MREDEIIKNVIEMVEQMDAEQYERFMIGLFERGLLDVGQFQ